MSEARFTPGPWEARESRIYADGGLLATVGFRLDADEQAANVSAITAVPELVEALRDMLAGWVYIRQSHGDLYGVGWDRAQGKAEAALSKAHGQKEA